MYLLNEVSLSFHCINTTTGAQRHTVQNIVRLTYQRIPCTVRHTMKTFIYKIQHTCQPCNDGEAFNTIPTTSFCYLGQVSSTEWIRKSSVSRLYLSSGAGVFQQSFQRQFNPSLNKAASRQCKLLDYVHNAVAGADKVRTVGNYELMSVSFAAFSFPWVFFFRLFIKCFSRGLTLILF